MGRLNGVNLWMWQEPFSCLIVVWATICLEIGIHEIKIGSLESVLTRAYLTTTVYYIADLPDNYIEYISSQINQHHVSPLRNIANVNTSKSNRGKESSS